MERGTSRPYRPASLVPLLFPILVGSLDAGPNPVDFESIYGEGRTVFYGILREGSQHLPLVCEDEKMLENAENKIPDLYEHLMNFYFYVHPGCDDHDNGFRSRFLNISASMADDLLASIPNESPHHNLSPLKVVLRSAGYFSKNYFPPVRHFARPVSRRVKFQSALQESDISAVHDLTSGEGIKVAVIDSGIDVSLREMKSRITAYKNFLDRSMPSGEKGKFPHDWAGHGTSVTSVIQRVAPRADLMIVKVYERESMRTVPPTRWTGYLLAAGLIWAVQNGADVINLSVALRADMPAVRQAVKYCWDHNVVLVTPMGNAFRRTEQTLLYFPAYYPWTIAVGGAEKHGEKLRIWHRSTFGSYLDLIAPADDLWVEVPSYLGQLRQARAADGNSLATSFVTGATALILSAMDEVERKRLEEQPGRLCETVRNILRHTASNDELGYSTPNPFSGYGMVGVRDAVQAAKSKSFH